MYSCASTQIGQQKLTHSEALHNAAWALTLAHTPLYKNVQRLGLHLTILWNNLSTEMIYSLPLYSAPLKSSVELLDYQCMAMISRSLKMRLESTHFKLNVCRRRSTGYIMESKEDKRVYSGDRKVGRSLLGLICRWSFHIFGKWCKRVKTVWRRRLSKAQFPDQQLKEDLKWQRLMI